LHNDMLYGEALEANVEIINKIIEESEA